MKFIDLFSGLGGFHVAMSKLGHECVFASELKKPLRDLYFKNFGIEPHGDITKVDVSTIPKHDILCGGFPCQPFSVSGKNLGENDKKSGLLILNILQILEYHKPTYFILENVPHLLSVKHAEFLAFIKEEFKRLGYTFEMRIYSPHEFGIPQKRKRVYIVGSLKGLDHFSWVIPNKEDLNITLSSILDNDNLHNTVPKTRLEYIAKWQQFLNCLPKNIDTPKFRLWAWEFGADYPIESVHTLTQEQLSSYKGCYGIPLCNMSYEEQLSNLPKYTHTNKPLSKYYIQRITKIRAFYAKYSNEIDSIKDQFKSIPHVYQQFEAQGDVDFTKGVDLNKYLIQFRPSGLRCIPIKYSPTLIHSHGNVPVLVSEGRYLSVKECAKLQSLSEISLFDNDNTSYSALGNAVNSEVVRKICINLLQ